MIFNFTTIDRSYSKIIVFYYFIDSLVKINLPLELCPEFTRMRTKFAELKEAIAKAMHKVKVKDLKEYISNHDKMPLKSHVVHCHKIKEIIQLIGNNCSLFDTVLLEWVAERFKVEEANKALKRYKNEIERFYQEGQPLRNFLDKRLNLASPLHCEMATVTVHKSVDDFDLKDIDILMTVAFQRLAPNVKVVVIREGNSFTIICSFPLTLSESLIATALENIEALIERGVQRLTIGYSTVYEV